jgi:hypothetical protein
MVNCVHLHLILASLPDPHHVPFDDLLALERNNEFEILVERGDGLLNDVSESFYGHPMQYDGDDESAGCGKSECSTWQMSADEARELMMDVDKEIEEMERKEESFFSAELHSGIEKFKEAANKLDVLMKTAEEKLKEERDGMIHEERELEEFELRVRDVMNDGVEATEQVRNQLLIIESSIPRFPPRNAFECKICYLVFFDEGLFKKHSQVKHHDHVCQITTCWKVFMYKAHLAEHKDISHPRFHCEPCDRGFYHQSDYDDHGLLHDWVRDPTVAEQAKAQEIQRYLDEYVPDVNQLWLVKNTSPETSKM